MALKVHRIVVVGCPRCVLTSSGEGVGKSCFCNRFVRPDTFSLQHNSQLNEETWKDNPIYNGDHFLYWGAATKRQPDGTKTRFQVVEQTEFYKIDDRNTMQSFHSESGYITRACLTHFISRGKVAYKLHEEEEYAIPSSLRSNPLRSRATQLFPNNEFSEGKGVSGFICLFDPTLQGHDIKIQVDFLTKLIKELLKTKRKVVLACTKCDQVSKGRIQLAANLAASINPRKPVPFIETSAKEAVNVDEAFYYIVGSHKKRILSKSVKHSPILLGSSYEAVLKSRGKDETYAVLTFNRLMKEKVNTFSSEWSDVWPYLQMDSSCQQAVEVMGIEQAKKIFCQRLMEIKVQEMRGKYGERHKMKQDDSRGFQSKLLEAFSAHPDLTNDGLYEFVYTPSLPSNDTPVKTSSSQSPATPRSSSLSPSLTPNILPPDPVNSPTHKTKSVSMSPPPPPPPPTSSIPTVSSDSNQILSNRTLGGFSPTNTSQGLMTSKFNRSSEFLSTFPPIPISNGSSSVRYRNRTLPPLPIPDQFYLQRSRLSRDSSLTTSQPDLDDIISETSTGTFERRRRLSNSMDCLHSNSTIAEEGTLVPSGYSATDIEASPYLQPIQIQQAINEYSTRNGPRNYFSMRLPKPRPHPSLPEGFMNQRSSLERTHSFKEKSGKITNSHFESGSIPNLRETVLISPGVKLRIRNSPPPPPSSMRLRSNSPILISPFLSPPGQSSLDFVDSGRVLQDEQSVNDNTSVISGPFAEVDEVSPIFSPISDSVHRKESDETSSTLSRNRYNSVTTSLGEEYVNITSQQEGLYASIPANDDDAYLPMKSGGSIEDLLETSPGKVNIIKRLQFTTSKSEMDTSPISSSPRRTTSVGSPSRIPRVSNVSISSIISGIETVIEESPSGSAILTGRSVPRQMSTQSMNVRPLPPSPPKHRRSEPHIHSTNKPKTSTGHNNIYESIDEDGADWLQQLKKRILARQKMEDKGNLFGSELALQCNQILEHFLSTPEVQKLWMASVDTVFPGFQLLEDFDIPPFSVNPEYFAQHVKSKQKVQSVIETNEPMTSETTEESTKHETKPSSEHHKLSMTDRLLVKMNQQLCQSSSDESDDEEGSDISEDVTSDVGGVDTLDSRAGTSLSSIHQQFSAQGTPGIQDMILGKLVNGDMKESDEEEEEDDEYSSEESVDDTQKTEVVRHVLKVEDNSLLQSSELRNNANVRIHIDQEFSGGEDSPLPDNSGQFNTKTHSNAIHLLSGHLDATHLNSLDSGISAYGSNGTDDC